MAIECHQCVRSGGTTSRSDGAHGTNQAQQHDGIRDAATIPETNRTQATPAEPRQIVVNTTHPRENADKWFWEKTIPEPNSGCLLWTGGYGTVGYGISVFWTESGKRERICPRIAYILAIGPIPDGLFILHWCDTPACVNPDHLRAGTHAENVMDRTMRDRSARPSLLRTHCHRGHEFTAENTYLITRHGHATRQCRRCGAENAKRKRNQIRMAA